VRFFRNKINQPVNFNPVKPQSLLLPALVVLSACGKPKDSAPAGAMPPASVTLASVAQEELVEWEEFTGRVEAVETVELRPRVSGYITEVQFEAGTLVDQDRVLFIIDQRPFVTQRDAAKAELKRAEAVAKAARQEYDRVSELLAAKAIAPEQGEARESAWRQAEAEQAAAAARLRSAELELSHCEVRAPIGGRVSRALTTPGNYVTAGVTVLTTLVTAAPVHVYVDIDENSLLKLQELRRENRLYTNGQGRVPVELQLSNEDGFRHRGHIESFDNRLNPATGSMVVRCEFANEDGVLTPGLFARVRLPMTDKYPALLIDEKSVLTDQANKYVLGVEEKNGGLVSVYKPVVIGPAIKGRRIVRSGLKAGERIIVNGMARLPQPGMPVAPVESSDKPAAGQAAAGK
jgi:RND family efflux transporter MFP subunit